MLRGLRTLSCINGIPRVVATSTNRSGLASIIPMLKPNTFAKPMVASIAPLAPLIISRPYTTEINEDEHQSRPGYTISDEHAKMFNISSKTFKKVMIRVHPDLMREYPNGRKLNEDTVKVVNNFTDAVENYVTKLNPGAFYKLPSPISVKFVYRDPNKEFRIYNYSIVLPYSLLTGKIDENEERSVRLMLNWYDDTMKEMFEKLAPRTGFKTFAWSAYLWPCLQSNKKTGRQSEMTSVIVLKQPLDTRRSRASSATSNSSFKHQSPIRKLWRKAISVRCLSITVAVLSVLVASTIISTTAGFRQKALQDSCYQSQFHAIVSTIKLQTKNLLDEPDKALTSMTNYFRRSNITFNTDVNQRVRDVYRDDLQFMISICAYNVGGCVSAFYWNNGKSFRGQMDIYENTIYNSTDTPLEVWYIDPDDNLDQTFNRTADTTFQYSGLVNIKEGEGSNCSSRRWWTDLQYYSTYNPPILVICYNSVFCKNNILIGYMFDCVELTGIQNTIAEILDGFQENAMMYIIDHDQTVIATSTGVYPYDLTTNVEMNTSNTNLTWISQSYAAYTRQKSDYFEFNLNGIDYLVSVEHNVTSYPDLPWTAFVISEKAVNTFTRNVVLTVVFVCVGVAVLIFVTSYLVTRSLFLLSTELEKVKLKVSRLELDLNGLSEPPIWEAQRLYKSFMMMHAALSSFRKFVPIELISHIMHSRREAFPYLYPTEATIYFQDIKDFTSLAETEDPEVLAANGGMIDKYIGDCIMALFNLPKSQSGHEQAATRSALECTEQLKVLNKRWKKLYNLELKHRIGINTGEVLAGNIGSSQRLAFTCIGDNVNLASRVEAVNKFFGTTVMITDTTYDKIDHEIFQTRKISTVRVAGKKRETIVYEVTGDKSQSYRDLCSSYQHVMDLYNDRKLLQAKAEVERLLDEHAYDVPSQRLRERISRALEKSEEWCIVEVLHK
ncbi:adenylate/guanylate cyclase [Planoprotostelium fungivorum]|uniref:Adenylate/guanylate cyclase n=1 Tax=Planoprotostelium fungivorum TaxID=1890364 RepID=A0A2P6N9D5_9EUKA|nr:adenylate/guanylate cyclase [Planoprotostelium fungivorum]